jgi:hypothetical protein
MPRCAALAAIATAAPALAGANARVAPMMDPDRPVICARDKSGEEWRIQCDDTARRCLYAPNVELDVDGNRIDKPLERARECSLEAFDRAAMEARGFAMVPGRADAPMGWTRDDRGRVFQVTFDMKRRMYFGVGYSPERDAFDAQPGGKGVQTTGMDFDFGLLVYEVLHRGKSPTRHRLRLFEGDVHTTPFEADVTLAHYDVSHRYFDPLLRITTFVGTPARHDLHLNLGGWTEVGGLELRDTPFGTSQLYKHATSEATLDVWQSRDMESYARFRTGMGLEGQYDDVHGYRSALSADSAFEVDWTLDHAGFHNLRLELSDELPHYFQALPGEPPPSKTGFSERMRARLQYEGIVLAINDQPVTLKLAAGGEKRNDLPGVPDVWAFVVDAGLRFNLWAPPHPHS